MSSIIKKLLFLLIILIFPTVVNAEVIKIKSFNELDESIKNQSILRGDNTITLPTSLDAVDENENDITIDNVTWNSTPAFNENILGRYVYTAVISSDYEVLNSATIPTININVFINNTIINGINYNLKQKAYKSLADTIWVNNYTNRKLYLQKYNKVSKTWQTRQTYTLFSNTLTFYYPSNWYKERNSIWRIHMPETTSYSGYTSKNINITTLRPFQNPSKYLQVRDQLNVSKKLGNIARGHMGLRVYYVQKKLKIKKDGYYGNNTRSAVKRFQKKKRIKADGVVGLKTWRKLGYSKKSWYALDRYVTPVKTNFYSTKSNYIETMIKTAYKYKKTKYIVGSSGKVKTGVDCSGLVMQALYSVGIDPYPVSVTRHTKPGYEFESRNLWKHKKIKKVAYKKRKRGDLIFYKNKYGTIVHVAIYLGKNKVIEAVPPKVVVRKIKADKKTKIAGVKRPII